MKSFLQGRSASSVAALRSQATPAESGFNAVCATPKAGGHGEGSTPTIESVKVGGKVTRLIVTCACGSRIEVECLYAED